MAAWTAPWTRICKFAPLVTCGRLTVLALDPCQVLAGVAIDNRRSGAGGRGNLAC